MSENTILSRLQTHFPILQTALGEVPVSAYQLVQAPSGTMIFDIGGACDYYLLLTQGRVGVKMLSKSGKSLLLYHVLPGQSCIITTSCLLGHAHYPTYGETETRIEALSIPRTAFSQALDRSSEFRKFVFDGLGQRLADVMQRLETVNFTSIDSRLAASLLAHRQDAQRIEITHEALAEEVGTAREVISRHLKKMEARGLVLLERGAVTLNNNSELEALCE